MAYKGKGYDAGKGTGSNRNIGMTDKDKGRLKEINAYMRRTGLSDDMYQKLAAEKRAIQAKYNK